MIDSIRYELNINLPKSKKFDYIIVGAGSSGCVLAHRLSENPSKQILVIEAGGDDRNIIIQMPAALAIAARHPKFDWAFMGEPEPFCNDRRILQHRGKVLGGSSSINGLVANRGNPKDYDAWAKYDLPSWSFPHCLEYFKKSETFSDGINPPIKENLVLQSIIDPELLIETAFLSNVNCYILSTNGGCLSFKNNKLFVDRNSIGNPKNENLWLIHNNSNGNVNIIHKDNPNYKLCVYKEVNGLHSQTQLKLKNNPSNNEESFKISTNANFMLL